MWWRFTVVCAFVHETSCVCDSLFRCLLDACRLSLYLSIITSNEERSNFIQYAWGRTRLPKASAKWERPFKLTILRNAGDNALPKAHTCFFQIELPENYSTDEIARKRIKGAMTWGMGEFNVA